MLLQTDPKNPADLFMVPKFVTSADVRQFARQFQEVCEGQPAENYPVLLREHLLQRSHRHTLRMVHEIQRRYPPRLFFHGFVSHNVLMKAHEVAQLPPPARNLTNVYRRFIKQRARVAVLAPEGFHLESTLAFFQSFYEQVRGYFI